MPTIRHRAFSLTWPASMQIYWKERKRLHKKRVQLPQDWLGAPIWPPWRHVKTLYSMTAYLIWYSPRYRSAQCTFAPSQKNRAEITVLICEQKHYSVWLSCRRKNYPYSVKIANVKGVQGIYFAFLIWDSGMLTVAALSLLWSLHGSFNKSKCLCNIKYRWQL